MIHLTVYCKDHRRRPVCFGIPPLCRDIQAAIPSGWCRVCGGEVFEPGRDRCVRCRDAKGAK